MDISQPVPAGIDGIDFGFLSSDEIKALSVKRVINPTTFDSLLHPTPGGLYDPAFGGFLDNRCATCSLAVFHGCPGHCGHIELPVKVYHPIFMDQCLRLLRATCAFCYRLKLPRLEINRYACKLTLIHFGLLKEAEQIDNIGIAAAQQKSSSNFSSNNVQENGTENESEDEKDMSNELIRQRNLFVRDSVKSVDRRASLENTEAIIEARREVMRDFFSTITKPKKCASCGAISPGYRRDRYLKFFRTTLHPKQHAHNVQIGSKSQNPLVELTKRLNKSKEKEHEQNGIMDEGVADMDLSSQEDVPASPSEFGEGAEEAGAMVFSEAASRGNAKSKIAWKKESHYIGAHEVHATLVLLFEQEGEILRLVYSPRSKVGKRGSLTADSFFVDTLLVPPSRFRPEGRANPGSDAVTEHPMNSLYKSILNASETINQIRREMQGQETRAGYRPRALADLQNAFVDLQGAVNALIDTSKSPAAGLAARGLENGVKQQLEKKEGLFRKNMMGKRVNFAARSVISPDPNIETNEIGVPPVFAMKLTFPEPVTSHNFQELKAAVLNGPNKWPGAAAIENENGQIINLKNKSMDERLALANQLLAPSNAAVNGAVNKKVHRHLHNGDVVIMNRQPTLHKPSMMAHRARVLPGEKTIRMHYANCNTYNADFDGDEMNMHFPQNVLGRAEAMTIADTDHQYLSGTAGKPLRGLIQDHISMGVQLTNRDVFFTREEYQQLLYSAIRPEDNHTVSGSIVTVAPAIWKPKPLWTGKQVVTTVLKNITPVSATGLNLRSKSQTPAALWGERSEEQKVIFSGGELVCGVLDKSQIGPASGGLVHSVYEAFGHRAAGSLLSILGRLLTRLLHMRAFSCGVDDLILTARGEEIRREKLASADAIGLEVAARYVTLQDRSPTADDTELKKRLESVLRDDEKQRGLDDLTKARSSQLSSEITYGCLPDELVKPFPKNQMQAMTGTGAKGSGVNANLISCNLGQQILEGRRVPTMVSGKTLPSFKPFDPSIRAGGYICQRFLTGIKPQEYFFHAMAGREGLIDTAVKTSRSGYLQRCLIKGMESIRVDYDTTVRDSSDGSIVQFLYGEDGLDVAKQKHLTEFKFLAQNFLAIFEGLGVRDEFNAVECEEASEWTKQALRQFRKTGDLDAGGMEPALSIWNPGTKAGSTSEKFFQKLKMYRDENPDRLLRDKKAGIKSDLTKKNFEGIMQMKYLKSVVDPGEAVGIIAGQSVGEPSTQMTLNTFHLAGHSSKNVTLGIPRLREIVMTASANILTPQMTVYLDSDITPEEGETFAKAISRLSLAQVVDNAGVDESVAPGIAYAQAKKYRVQLDFFPADEYRKEYAIKPDDILDALSKKFLPHLQSRIRTELKKLGDESTLRKATESRPEIGQSVGRIAEETPRNLDLPDMGDDLDGDDEDADGDATNQKQRSKRQEMVSYENADDEEEVIRRDQNRDEDDEADEQQHEDESYASREGTPATTQVGDETDKEQDRIQVAQKKQQALEERVKGIRGNTDLATFRFAEEGNRCVFVLEYPASSPKLLLLPHVEHALHATVIQSIPGLGACFYEKAGKFVDTFTGDEEANPYIITEGVNLTAMREYQDIINPHRLFTNSVAHMLQYYGIEAARATIAREIASVFRSHAISVDPRHLQLIADYMTRSGEYRAFNRTGLRNATSSFAKMSFETTVAFLKDAVLEQDRETLKGPSARIVMGKLSGVGTGSFEVLQRVGGGF